MRFLGNLLGLIALAALALAGACAAYFVSVLAMVWWRPNLPTFVYLITGILAFAYVGYLILVAGLHLFAVSNPPKG